MPGVDRLRELCEKFEGDGRLAVDDADRQEGATREQGAEPEPYDEADNQDFQGSEDEAKALGSEQAASREEASTSKLGRIGACRPAHPNPTPSVETHYFPQHSSFN